MSAAPSPVYLFGPFRLDTREGTLLKDGQLVPLTPKALDLLVVLARQSGQILEKDELLKQVWPDAFVEEGNLTVHVSALRKALGDGAGESAYIETIPRRGYRFCLPVEEVWEERPTLVVERRTETRIIQQEVEESALGLRVGSRRGMWMAAAAGLLLVAAIAWNWDRIGALIAGPQRIGSIAVLPFENLTGNAANDYIVEGLTESTITEVGKTPGWTVIARNSVLRFQGSKQSIPQIASALGVQGVVEGALLDARGQLRVNVKFVDGQSARTLWTASFERSHDEASGLPWEIARELVRSAGGQQSNTKPAGHVTHNVEAHRLYLQGRYYSNLRRQQALENYEQAIARDPDYAPAYLGLAETCIWLGGRGIIPGSEAGTRARAALQKALEIDPEYAEARLLLGLVKFQFDFDFVGAGKDLEIALLKAPNYANGHQWYGAYLQAMGRFEEGIHAVESAQRLDPFSLPIGADLGRAHYFSRRYDRAIQQLQKTLGIDPKFIQAHYLLGLCYLETGRAEEAIREIESATDFRGAWLGYAYARSGRTKDARQVLNDRIAEWERSHTGAAGIALIYAGLQDRNSAFQWLEKARVEKDASMPLLNAYPYWDSLRTDPRFKLLVERVGLPFVEPSS